MITNTKITRTTTILFFISIHLLFLGCKKYLDKKPNQTLVVPRTIQDVQSLLDFTYRVNYLDPVAGEISADDYYLPTDILNGLNDYDKRTYTWEKDNLFPKGGNNDWSNAYDNIYRANIVLDNIDKINRSPNDQMEFDNAKGHALFLRGKCFWHIVDIWTSAYEEGTASTALGIPLRLTPDFNLPSNRPSLEQSYQQILRDLKQAATLLPATPKHVTRPSKPAAYALIARTYLMMNNADSCLRYANLCLQLKGDLIDYNSYPSAPFAFQSFNNSEIIYYSTLNYSDAIAWYYAKADSNLYNSFSSDDRRKTVLFGDNGDGTFYFGSSYGEYSVFGGLATDEVYLMRAESFARKNMITEAMNDLNTLLIKRWTTNNFTPYTATDQADALSKILSERRKELIMRGLRWMDIKRLNKGGANISLQRIINGQTYTLPPNDPRFALPIPEDVIAISGMQQNSR